MAQVLRGLGFKGREVEGALRFRPAARRPAPDGAGKPKEKTAKVKGQGKSKTSAAASAPSPKIDPHSPFAKLKDLVLS